MNPLPVDQFALIVQGEFNAKDKAPASGRTPITGFALDNREVKPGDLFIAIKGERVDGHDFASLALAAGAVAVLCERPIEGPYVVVDSVVEALARLGRHYRDQFHGPVIGVTGSAGKTTTKELIVAALSPKGAVLKAEGNRNTEYTSPLLWTELGDDGGDLGDKGDKGDLNLSSTRSSASPLSPPSQNSPHSSAQPWSAVVEMGMRGFGQIAHLASISKPTIGVITNIGWSHAELVGSRKGIAQAKGELLEALPPGAPGVLWEEDEFLPTLRANFAHGPVYTFGSGKRAINRLLSYRAKSWWSSEITGVLNPRVGEDEAVRSATELLGISDPVNWTAELPAVGRHVAINATAAVLVAALAGVHPVEAAAALKHTKFPPMRMEIRSVNGGTVVLDTYNAAPNSVVAALETLKEVPCEGKRLAVLGEMRELGSTSEEGHRLVGRALAESNVQAAIFYGATSDWMRDEAIQAGMEAESLSIASSLEDVTDFIAQIQPADTMLIKGSRSLELERALEPLEEV